MATIVYNINSEGGRTARRKGAVHVSEITTEFLLGKLVGKTVSAIRTEFNKVEIHFDEGEVLVLEAKGYEGTKLEGHVTFVESRDLEF